MDRIISSPLKVALAPFVLMKNRGKCAVLEDFKEVISLNERSLRKGSEVQKQNLCAILKITSEEYEKPE